MTTSLAEPFPRFDDLSGAPINGGFIYVGAANLNPITNPISIFFDAALTIGATQPLRTSGGFIVDGSGSPANIYVAGTTDFSLAVQDRFNVPLYSIASYPVRMLASSLTFDTITLSTSAVPDAAGGAFIGTIALPWSSMVSRDAQVKNLSIYNETHPAVAADLVKLNQRCVNLLVAKQTNAAVFPAATTVNIYNCGTIRHVALGVYEVPFTISPATANVVPLVQVQDSTSFYANASIDAGLAFVDVTIFNAAGAAADATFGIVVVGYPDIADPIL
jgi:hypothetical protein